MEIIAGIIIVGVIILLGACAITPLVIGSLSAEEKKEMGIEDK
jgi:hypothetical protein